MRKFLLLMIALLTGVSGAWADTANVTYQIVYNGSNSISATVEGVDVGSALSIPNQLKRGYISSYTIYSDAACTAGNEITTVTSSGNVTVYVKAVLSGDCPITFSTDESPVWYVLKGKPYTLNGSSINRNIYANSAGTGSAADIYPPVTTSHQWAFIGNPFEFKLKNGNGKYVVPGATNGSAVSLDNTGQAFGLFKNGGGASGHIAMAIYDGTNQNVLQLFNGEADNMTSFVNSSTSATFSEGSISGLSSAFFYPYAYYEKAITDYYNTYVDQALKKCGTVGYPSKSETTYTALMTYCSTNFSGATPTYNATTLSGVIEKFQDLANVTTIAMPTEGKVYTFTNVGYNGKLKYVYVNDGKLTNSNTKPTDGSDEFICHIVDATYYAFVGKSGYWFAGATHETDGDVLSKDYNTKPPFTINKFASTNSGNILSSPEKAFGKFGFSFANRIKKDNQATVLLVPSSGTWNAAGAHYFNSSFSSMYQIKEVDDWYNKVTLTSDGTDAYASIYLPFSVTIPSGITAYAVTAQDASYATLNTIVTNGTLPKETGAILKKAGQDENETIYLSPATEAGSYAGSNMLRGTVTTTVTPANTYVLGNADGFIGMYPYSGTNLAKGKAYLTTAGVKALKFSFGDETAINSTEEVKGTVNGPIFNLAGQRLQKLQKGVNIVNGKTVIK